MTGELQPQASELSLLTGEAPRALKRSRQVKVTLNAAELGFLDQIVAQMGSDRSSVFRHLLHLAEGNAFAGLDETAVSEDDDGVPRLDSPEVREMEQRYPRGVKMFEPRGFDEIPVAVQALRERKTVILNLNMMKPDQAQRAVDFVAGGTFAIDGHQERVGESIFLFVPSGVPVEAVAAASVASAKQQTKGSRPPLLAETPFALPVEMETPVLDTETPRNESE